MLERAGYCAQTARNGQEALNVIRKAPSLDLIILDIQMPDMNGYTFLTHLRKMENYQSVPFVIVTAYPEMEPIFRRKGIKDYLLKPIKFEDLLAKIKEILGD